MHTENCAYRSLDSSQIHCISTHVYPNYKLKHFHKPLYHILHHHDSYKYSVSSHLTNYYPLDTQLPHICKLALKEYKDLFYADIIHMMNNLLPSRTQLQHSVELAFFISFSPVGHDIIGQYSSHCTSLLIHLQISHSFTQVLSGCCLFKG